MAGTSITVDDRELQRLEKRLSMFWRRLSRPTQGMKAVATIIESQTKRRIQDEKESPDGQKWEDWSPKYAETRHANNSLLENRGHLYKDIASDYGSDFAEAFTSLIYGRTHQEGDDTRNIPARPYFGLSRDNADEVAEVFAEWTERQL